MQTQALARTTSTTFAPGRRAENPAHFNAEALELMQVNPQLAARSMTQLAVAKRDTERELNISRESSNDLMAFGVSSAIVAAIGLWEGSVLAKRGAIIQGWEEAGILTENQEPVAATWKAQGVKEPGKIGPVPMSLGVPIIFGILSVVAAARRSETASAGTAERIFATTATTTFGVFLAGLTRAHGYRKQQVRMVTAAAQAQAQATGT